MKIGLAQINSTIGNFAHNAEQILTAYRELSAQGAHLVITPELALTGYPPQDLLFAGEFVDHNLIMLAELEKQVGSVPLLVGFVDHNTTGQGKPFYNAAAVLQQGAQRVIAYKQLLPTYDVFDEARYFEPGKSSTMFSINGQKIGITICEDLWTAEYLSQSLYSIDPPQKLVDSGATLLVNLSASPFQQGKPARRLAMLKSQAKRFNVPIIYCNSVGGNDQLVFDGHSLVVAPNGESWFELAGFRKEISIIDLNTLDFFRNSTDTANCDVAPVLGASSMLYTLNSCAPSTPCTSSAPAILERSLFPKTFHKPQQPRDEIAEVYDALVLGIRDYVQKCGFKKVILGLSGGIDSALVAVLAVAALGPEAVTAVSLPGPFSSEGSVDDAQKLATTLSITYHKIPITPLYETMLASLKEIFSNTTVDTTEENIQARFRAITLMALSNKFGGLLLTTGNKSELAVGYCTLYGDMCGGLAAISDIPKTLVYQLAHWVNRKLEIIPWSTIEKPPSAELRPNQKDQDSLPPYELLDAVLQLYIEENFSLKQIVARGFDELTVRWIIGLVNRNEYKRQQAAPGIKVTGRAFGMGRRLPIAAKHS
ncbi:MAG: NAD+ synthase [Verrucomicrobia bacterium RIFCSPHIGHO2_12_FULL_41_10]|nr:MAG: NAD+ synthase [Verrucomicrobia bacterium RIFCSPHIGHO2_12_FULL_41_10]HLB32745.1 NAD+ synthase [Chthoniobacterales bacterium]